MTVIGRPPILRPILSSANSAASRMSPPAALRGPVNVPRKPILMSCAAAGPFSATRTASPARVIRISSSRLFASAFDAELFPQHLGREVCALAHRLELLPDHRVVDFGAVQRLR